MSLAGISGVSAASNYLAASAQTESTPREQRAPIDRPANASPSTDPLPAAAPEISPTASPSGADLPTAVRAPDGAADTSTTPAYNMDGEPTDPDDVGGPNHIDAVV